MAEVFFGVERWRIELVGLRLKISVVEGQRSIENEHSGVASAGGCSLLDARLGAGAGMLTSAPRSMEALTTRLCVGLRLLSSRYSLKLRRLPPAAERKAI